MSAVRRAFVGTVATLVACVAIFVLVEGLSSTLLLAWDSTKLGGQLDSGRHVRFDDQLGWTNLENTTLVDRYGPGRSIYINAQGLRAKEPIAKAVPTEQIRILCSGDSFTFGKGSDNSTTWCAQLGARRADLQSVNAGEEGYGLGQAFLKAKKMDAQLDWDINVFTFIADDIRRMGTLDFVGRNKPRIVFEDGKMVVQNQPVPRASDISLWMRANRRTFQHLRFLELSSRLGQKMAGNSGSTRPQTDDERSEIAGSILEAAKKMSEAKGAKFVAVFLPSGAQDGAAEAVWRPRIAAECSKRGIEFIDAVGAAKAQLTLAERGPHYDPKYGHYSAAGNRFIADHIWETLSKRPEFAARLKIPGAASKAADDEAAPAAPEGGTPTP